VKSLCGTLIALVAATALAAAAPAPPAGLGLHLAACTVGKSKVPARCGTFVVYEDRAAVSGRAIALRLVVLRAKHPSGRAIVWNPGGPGASAVDFAPFIADGSIAKDLSELRNRYDVVLLDNRGIGGPSAQQCDLTPAAHPDTYFLQLWPDDALAACRARLARNANLSLYTTSLAADDLDDLRAALGYPKIVLNGGSYGTYFYLVYMRQHPDRVESAVLDGVAPPHLLIIPLEDAAGAQLAMNALIAACARDRACRANFPRFADHFSALVRRFDNGPVRVRIQNAVTKQPQTVMLSKEVFAERLRQTLYDPGAGAYVPYVVERAYRGDDVPLGLLVQVVSQGLATEVEAGLNLSVTCAEDIPFITEADVRRTSADSFEGDVRVRAQQRACRIWKVDSVPASFNATVHSTAPVLMVSGSDDPTSPAAFAAQQLASLPNAKRVLVTGAGHVTEIPCTDRLKVAFVRAGSARGLNVSSCSAAFHRPPFRTSMAGFGD
jgi:pimeloyl-ACP methyl ester carboxylesterase